jgi:hypothetical protein
VTTEPSPANGRGASDRPRAVQGLRLAAETRSRRAASASPLPGPHGDEAGRPGRRVWNLEHLTSPHGAGPGGRHTSASGDGRIVSPLRGCATASSRSPAGRTCFGVSTRLRANSSPAPLRARRSCVGTDRIRRRVDRPRAPASGRGTPAGTSRANQTRSLTPSSSAR